jgi:hypothetical protein
MASVDVEFHTTHSSIPRKRQQEMQAIPAARAPLVFRGVGSGHPLRELPVRELLDQ